MLTIISLKLVCCGLAKAMVNWESTKKVIPNIYSAGQSIVVSSLPYIQASIPWIKSPSSQAADNGATAPASTEYLVYNWLEAMTAYIQMAMLWEDYVISLCAVLGIVGLFLLLTCFAPRFYATIMIAMFVYNLTKVWFRHIWPEIRVKPDASKEEESRLDVDRWTVLHPNILNLAELRQLFGNLIKISELYLKILLALRSKRPISFCLAVCLTLSCTAYIGNSFSGLDLLFWITYALFLAPGTYLYLLPQSARDYLRENFRNIIAQAQSSEFDVSQPPPPSTLFELLKHLAKQESTSTTQLSSSSDVVSLLEMQRVSSTTESATLSPIKSSINNPTTPSQSRRFETMMQVKEEDEEDSESHQNNKPRKSSDDLSSNGSASMIDSDEDQQDGFVIL